MKKPLAKCCNGCDAPPQKPSWVLCRSCLDALDKRVNALLGKYTTNPGAVKT